MTRLTQVPMTSRTISATQVFDGLINELQCAQQILVGFSGGLDSTVLLNLLTEVVAAERITAVHINHGLSSQADQWQEHAQRQCKVLGVAYHGETVKVISAGGGLEEAARNLRYQVFERLLVEGGILLLGHHQNDQAETVLYRLMRGSGPRGLAGIPTQRAIGLGKLYRPLLCWPKQNLTDYAHEHKLDFVEDETNQEEQYDRNFLRHQVVPALAKRWPDYLKRLNNIAQISQETDELCREMAAQDMNVLKLRQERAGASLCLSSLKLLSVARQRNVLRHWPQRYNKSALNGKIVDQVFRSVIDARADAAPKVQCKDIEFRRYRQRLYILDSNELASSPPFQRTQVIWSDQTLSWSASDMGLTLSRVTGDGFRVLSGQQISVSYRIGGEVCHPAGRVHSNSLKKCLQEGGVEPRWRHRVPLIYVDDSLAAVGDLWVCKGWSVGAEEDGIKINWLSNSL